MHLQTHLSLLLNPKLIKIFFVLIADCAKSTSVMSTNAVAFVLLYRYRNGATVEQLVEALDNLRTDLFNAGRDIGFSGDSIDVLNYAVSRNFFINFCIFNCTINGCFPYYYSIFFPFIRCFCLTGEGLEVFYFINFIIEYLSA